ncbi:MAG: substrate-binding domain-containing protein, partial [Actinomycetota bacterium]|nr:substrate-binding domain-containing protein [Actinomycetota bacterium]
MPDVLNPFFALVAEGIGDEARRRDYVLVLCSTDSDAAREASFARLLRARRLDGIDPDTVSTIRGDYRLESGRAAAATLLAGEAARRPTALLVANDLMAVGCIQHALSLGIGLPRELGVIGYDDIPLATVVTPALTTVRQPARKMGRVAAELLLD